MLDVAKKLFKRFISWSNQGVLNALDSIHIGEVWFRGKKREEKAPTLSSHSKPQSFFCGDNPRSLRHKKGSRK